MDGDFLLFAGLLVLPPSILELVRFENDVNPSRKVPQALPNQVSGFRLWQYLARLAHLPSIFLLSHTPTVPANSLKTSP